MTVEEALEDIARNLTDEGLVSGSKDALYWLNRSLGLLWSMDDWEFTNSFLTIGISSAGTFFPPYGIETIKSARRDCRKVAIIREEQKFVDEHQFKNFPEIHISKTGIVRPFPGTWTKGKVAIKAVSALDAGKKVRFSVKTEKGSIENFELELKADFQLTDSDSVAEEILSVSKDATNGKVDLISTNTECEESLIYSYFPRERHPKYHQYQASNCSGDRTIVIRGKKRYEKISEENLGDELPIDDIDALEFGALAVYNKRNNKYEGYIERARAHLEVYQEDLDTTSDGYVAGRMNAVIGDQHGRY